MADPKQPRPIPTLAGQNLLVKTQAGKLLNFTRVGIGAGDVGAGPDAIPYESATDIADQRIGAAITQITKNGGEATIEYAWSNAALATGFSISEIVLFAEDPDTAEEVAYVYIHFPEGARPYVPATGGTTVVEALEAIVAIVAGAAPDLVQATINESLIYATREWTRDLLTAEYVPLDGFDARAFEAVQRESDLRRADPERVGADADTVDGAHLDEIVQPGDVKFGLYDTPPNGYLELDGAELLIVDYQRLYDRAGPWLLPGLDDEHFRLLDMPGETPRGWDNGRGVDPGRVLGSWQDWSTGRPRTTAPATIDQNGNPVSYRSGATNPSQVAFVRVSKAGEVVTYDTSNSVGSSQEIDVVHPVTGDPETRGRNLAFMFVIRY